MGKIYVKATPVSIFAAAQTYNYSAIDPQMGGIYDIGNVWTDAPGPYAGMLTNFTLPDKVQAGTLTSGVLPNPIYAPQPGYIISAWETNLGWAEFICLAVPKSAAIPVGTIVTWDAAYNAVAESTTKSVGQQVAVSVASATISSGNPVTDPLGGGLASNGTNVMYTWFLLSGRAWTLKTAVQVTPNVPIFVSTTAGRFKVVSSAGGQYLGARASTATTTSTQSMAVVLWNRSVIEGA
jgi:hypothetical protein